MLLAIIGVLLVIWLACIIIGLAVKALLWLAVVGAILFVATMTIGATRHLADRHPRG